MEATPQEVLARWLADRLRPACIACQVYRFTLTPNTWYLRATPRSGYTPVDIYFTPNGVNIASHCLGWTTTDAFLEYADPLLLDRLVTTVAGQLGKSRPVPRSLRLSAPAGSWVAL
jgi:hypothetical protein